MAQNITIGFIGYGNMAQAIAQGLVDAGVVKGGDIVACAAHYDKLEASTAKLGARPLHNAREVAAAADVVVIAIKPYQIESVIKPIADEFAKNGRFVVSIAAGWDLAKYQKLFGDLAQSIHIQCTFRTRRWPSARACSSPRPTTRSPTCRRRSSNRCSARFR